MDTKKFNFSKSFEELKDINEWFHTEEINDLDIGLEKLKRGKELIKLCEERLQEIENEFKEITDDLEIKVSSINEPQDMSEEETSF